MDKPRNDETPGQPTVKSSLGFVGWVLVLLVLYVLSIGPVGWPGSSRNAVLVALSTAAITIRRSRPYVEKNSRARLTWSTYVNTIVACVLPR